MSAAKPPGWVRVILTFDSTTVLGAITGNAYSVEPDRAVWMHPDDAKIMIGGPHTRPDLRAANLDLLARLGNVPKPSLGVKVADLIGNTKSHPLDRVGAVKEALVDRNIVADIRETLREGRD